MRGFIVSSLTNISWIACHDVHVPINTGGPYKKPFATYREFGCIPDDTYAFTIFDFGGQVIDNEDPFASENDAAAGSYLMGINYDKIKAGS